MSLPAVRAALVAMWLQVPDIGRVHSYQRYCRSESDFQALYLYEAAPMAPHLRGWYVTRTSTEERTLGIGRVLNRHTWTARGYLTLNDEYASELVMDDLIEGVRAAWRADPTLGGVCTAETWGSGTDGVQVADSGPVLFCGVLCHSAVLTLQTMDYPSHPNSTRAQA